MRNSWQAEVLVCSTSYQGLQLEKIVEKLHYYKASVERWLWWQPLPVKLLKSLCQSTQSTKHKALEKNIENKTVRIKIKGKDSPYHHIPTHQNSQSILPHRGPLQINPHWPNGSLPLHFAQWGNRYIMVAIHLDANYIFIEPMQSRSKEEMIRAYKKKTTGRSIAKSQQAIHQNNNGKQWGSKGQGQSQQGLHSPGGMTNNAPTKGGSTHCKGGSTKSKGDHKPGCYHTSTTPMNADCQFTQAVNAPQQEDWCVVQIVTNPSAPWPVEQAPTMHSQSWPHQFNMQSPASLPNYISQDKDNNPSPVRRTTWSASRSIMQEAMLSCVDMYKTQYVVSWEDKAMGQGATLNAVEDYWPWPGRSPMVGPPLFVMIK